MYTICTSKRNKKPPTTSRKDSYECLPDRDGNYCSNSAGMVLLTLEAIPASPTVERSGFRKQTWQVPSLPTCGLTSSESLFSRSASASVPTHATESQGICTSHQPHQNQAQFWAGLLTDKLQNSTFELLNVPNSAGEQEGVCDIRQGLPAGKHTALCLALPGLTFTFWLFFAALLLTINKTKTKIN